MRAHKVERILRDRYEGGSDWDSPRSVLVRNGKKEVQWWHAGSSWQGRLSGYQPFGASLITVDYSDKTHRWATLHEGGRLSKKLFLQYADKINAFIGAPVADQLSIRHTLIVDEA